VRVFTTCQHQGKGATTQCARERGRAVDECTVCLLSPQASAFLPWCMPLWLGPCERRNPCAGSCGTPSPVSVYLEFVDGRTWLHAASALRCTRRTGRSSHSSRVSSSPASPTQCSAIWTHPSGPAAAAAAYGGFSPHQPHQHTCRRYGVQGERAPCTHPHRAVPAQLARQSRRIVVRG
jgi:hypothetical protein